MGPANSLRISRVLRYSGADSVLLKCRIRGCHPLWPIFPDRSTISSATLMSVLLPHPCRNTSGLGCSAFARHYLRNHCYFLFLRVLRCFSSPRWLTAWRYGPCGPGCPIRRFTGRGLFAPRRNFSQLITSFFASESLGILHAPLFTFFWPRATARAALGLIWVCFCSCFTLFPSCQGSFLWRITDSNR